MKFSKDELRFLIQMAACGYGLSNDGNDSIEDIESAANKYASSPNVQQVERALFEINSILKLIKECKNIEQ